MNGIILLVGILLLVMLITLLAAKQWGELLLFFPYTVFDFLNNGWIIDEISPEVKIVKTYKTGGGSSGVDNMDRLAE